MAKLGDRIVQNYRRHEFLLNCKLRSARGEVLTYRDYDHYRTLVIGSSSSSFNAADLPVGNNNTDNLSSRAIAMEDLHAAEGSLQIQLYEMQALIIDSERKNSQFLAQGGADDFVSQFAMACRSEVPISGLKLGFPDTTHVCPKYGQVTIGSTPASVIRECHLAQLKVLYALGREISEEEESLHLQLIETEAKQKMIKNSKNYGCSSVFGRSHYSSSSILPVDQNLGSSRGQGERYRTSMDQHRTALTDLIHKSRRRSALIQSLKKGDRSNDWSICSERSPKQK